MYYVYCTYPFHIFISYFISRSQQFNHPLCQTHFLPFAINKMYPYFTINIIMRCKYLHTYISIQYNKALPLSVIAKLQCLEYENESKKHIATEQAIYTVSHTIHIPTVRPRIYENVYSRKQNERQKKRNLLNFDDKHQPIRNRFVHSYMCAPPTNMWSQQRRCECSYISYSSYFYSFPFTPYTQYYFTHLHLAQPASRLVRRVATFTYIFLTLYVAWLAPHLTRKIPHNTYIVYIVVDGVVIRDLRVYKVRIFMYSALYIYNVRVIRNITHIEGKKEFCAPELGADIFASPTHIIIACIVTLYTLPQHSHEHKPHTSTL